MKVGNNIPKHWHIKKLIEFGEIVSGGTPSTKVSEFWDGNISWISPADLSGYGQKIILKGRKSITTGGLKNSSARLITKGSVLFSSRAPIGYVVIAGNEVRTNQGFKSIFPINSIYNEYLFYFLKSAEKQPEKVASGATFKEISLKAFSNLDILLPPSSEQKAIVSKIEELLSDLENGNSNFKQHNSN
jgi:type I restriction enzyme S subunit